MYIPCPLPPRLSLLDSHIEMCGADGSAGPPTQKRCHLYSQLMVVSGQQVAELRRAAAWAQLAAALGLGQLPYLPCAKDGPAQRPALDLVHTCCF